MAATDVPCVPRASHAIANDGIAKLGRLHYGRKEVQPASSEIRSFYRTAAKALKHELMTFRATQIESVAVAFGESIAKIPYTCYACAIMPDHVHVLLRKHRHAAEQMIAELQGSSRRRVLREGFCPPDHPVWRGPGWKVFLDDPEGVRRTIRYIERNPTKMGLPAQGWSFVKQYDNWPFHPGHSPNSPYARRGKGEPFRK